MWGSFFVLLLKASSETPLILRLMFVPAGDCSGGGTSFQQQLLLPDTWNLIAVEEHAFPLGVI